MKMTGNTVFIPGATSGIGLELAIALQAKGNTVVVGGRRTELLERIRAEHPGISAVQIDISDPASIRTAAQQVLTEHPDVNVLIAMAGIMRVEDWHHPESFLQSAEEIITTNVLGTIRLIANFIEHLQARPEATVITVSSGLAFAPLKVTPSYNASKAAIHMLSETLRLQLADTTVSVKELQPPAVRTDLMPGQQESDFAMPLKDFADEVIAPGEAERDAERDGRPSRGAPGRPRDETWVRI